jgi:hypothetical protein
VVNQVRSGAVAAANVDQVRCWEQASGLDLPGADAAGGSSSAMNRYPNEPSICLAMRHS